ncbi:MAG TPA: HD-GYP domain-containing protein [Burkholderiaceae bacterium]|nr:HD-GYP domain-containing protein [Burkholderiaceae bacterium]
MTLITASRRYQVAVGDLSLGMFVAELDRPWLDTPFLLQGFVVDSQVELETLRRCCGYVYVDLELSSPDVADAIRRAEVQPGAEQAPEAEPAPAPAPKAATPEAVEPPKPRPGPPRVYRTRADVRISSDTRQRFRQFVRSTAAPVAPREDEDDGVLRRALGWLADRFGNDGPPARRGAGSPERDRTNREALKAWLPPDVELVDHRETHAMTEELPRARRSFARGEEVLKAVVADVKVGRVPQVAEVAGAVDDMVDSMLANPDALLWVGRLRDEDIGTYNHGVKVALYLIALGRHLGLPKRELGWLGLTGMLADVGKIRLPRALLDKPGMLAPSEFGLVKEHVRLGLDALRACGSLPAEVELGIAQHHERLDGTGYPRALKGNEISLWGRMAGIADSFAALITPRAYANPIAPQDALMNLYEWAGTSFHEPLVEQFVQAVGVFPTGSLVELSTGEVAVVVAHNRVRRLEPRVLVLTWPDKSPLATPIERDLLQQGRRESGRVRIVRGLAAGAYGLRMRDYYLGDVDRVHGLAA